jgi:hypothetical protein
MIEDVLSHDIPTANAATAISLSCVADLACTNALVTAHAKVGFEHVSDEGLFC